jgi:NAD(P)-dependent dehydrogenase (short-subunit alcohol dehydrogenase family)
MGSDLVDKSMTIVVTGAASGVGAATARQLAGAGHQVFALDIKPTPAGVGAHVACDLSDGGSIDQAVDQLPSAIDALVNVAGVPGPTPAELVVRVNFLGLRRLTEALFDRIASGGAVVNVASVAGREWQRRADLVGALLDTPDFDTGLEWCRQNTDRWAKDPYTFSKQCVVAYSLRSARRAFAQGLRSNSVSPGGVETPLTPAFRAQMGAQFDWMAEQTGRQAEPDEIAEVIVYLATGPCRWLNGVDVVVDGGVTGGILSGTIDVSRSPAALARAARDASRVM